MDELDPNEKIKKFLYTHPAPEDLPLEEPMIDPIDLAVNSGGSAFKMAKRLGSGLLANQVKDNEKVKDLRNQLNNSYDNLKNYAQQNYDPVMRQQQQMNRAIDFQTRAKEEALRRLRGY